jgi:hypothetical protein
LDEESKSQHRPKVMNQQGTRFDKIVSRIKNNPIGASLIVIGTIIIAVSTFTSATKTLLGLVTGSKNVDVTGKWATQELINPFDGNDKFRLFFDFEIKGNTLLGSVRQASTTDHYNIRDGILDGNISGNVISFYRLKQAWFGNETVTYKDFYYGSVLKGEIEFTLQSDRPWGFPPQKFVARRE